MTGARVSIVVPHYGDPRPTGRLLDALRAQTAADRTEVIVVDDRSPEPFPETEGVTVVRREHNGGFGAAVNSGAALATEPLLMVLNSDLEVSETFVADFVSAASPWLPAVVSPRVVGQDGSPLWTGRHFPRVRHQAVEWLVPLARHRHRRILHEWVGHDTSVRVDASATVDWVVGAALLLPTDDFRAVGGFDERFFMNSEEIDLQRRLRERGLPSVVLPEPSVVHEVGGSSDPLRRRAWLVRSRLDYADKWGSRRRLQLALLAATAVNLCWNAGRRALGRPVHPLSDAREEAALLTQRTAR